MVSGAYRHRKVAYVTVSLALSLCLDNRNGCFAGAHAPAGHPGEAQCLSRRVSPSVCDRTPRLVRPGLSSSLALSRTTGLAQAVAASRGGGEVARS
jgi:hypothetical protein